MPILKTGVKKKKTSKKRRPNPKILSEETIVQYIWKDKNTKIEIIIDRKLKDCDIPPDKQEALVAGMTIEDFAHAVWEKIITGGIGHIGFGQKGHW